MAAKQSIADPRAFSSAARWSSRESDGRSSRVHASSAAARTSATHLPQPPPLREWYSRSGGAARVTASATAAASRGATDSFSSFCSAPRWSASQACDGTACSGRS